MALLYLQNTINIIHQLDNPLGIDKLDGIELWAEDQNSQHQEKDEIYWTKQYINPRKLPMWSLGDAYFKVCTRTHEAKEFFGALYNSCGKDSAPIGDLGLLLTTDTNSTFKIVYFERQQQSDTGIQLKCANLDFSILNTIVDDTPIIKIEDEDESTAVFIENNSSKKRIRSSTQLDVLSRRRSRSCTPFEMAAKMKMRLNKRDQDLYIRMKGRHGGDDNTALSSSSSRGSTIEPTTTQKESETSTEQKNRTTIQRVVLSELRLREISKTHPDYKQLYHHTYKAAAFSLRNKISRNEIISLRDIHDIVDRLLSMFLI